MQTYQFDSIRKSSQIYQISSVKFIIDPMHPVCRRNAGFFNSRKFLQDKLYIGNNFMQRSMDVRPLAEGSLDRSMDSGRESEGKSMKKCSGGKAMAGEFGNGIEESVGRSLRKIRVKQCGEDRSMDGKDEEHIEAGLKRVNTEPVEACFFNGQSSQKLFPKIASPRQRFPKPYLENTKFVDLVMRNKKLLRRGMFDLPLESIEIQVMIPKRERPTKSPPPAPILSPLKIKSTALNSCTPSTSNLNPNPEQIVQIPQPAPKSCLLLKKQLQKQHERIRQKNHHKHRNKLKIFSKTVEKCAEEYESLMAAEEKDPILLRNSMNRIIAIDGIKSRMKLKV